MENVTINFYEFIGSSYEIGQQLGQNAMKNPQFLQMQKSDASIFSDAQVAQMNEMFSRYCPGLSDELKGFADAVGASENQLYYYAGTCLTPGCSLLAVLPKLTKDGYVLVARNYEFSHKMDDFSFSKTEVTGKYAHIGSSSMFFGRSEGINECGLMVGQTSCGLPVGNFAHSTNHAHLPKIKPLSPMAMEHSACRYNFISNYMAKTDKLTIADLKALTADKGNINREVAVMPSENLKSHSC